jgi:ADP-ribose pyrophosphatase
MACWPSPGRRGYRRRVRDPRALPSPVPAWRPLDTRALMRSRVFSVRATTQREDPVPGEPQKEGEFYVIDAPDWVNVVALTEDDQLLLIEQWRHGIDAVTLEIPGGMVDPGETPAAAARRELLEETGFAAARWAPLGTVTPNPAIQSNRCHTFVALGCARVATPRFDGNERIHLRPVPYAEVPGLVAEGAIHHALVVAALGYEALRRAGVLVAVAGA